jgi:selenocysteine-specific elongation factor
LRFSEAEIGAAISALAADSRITVVGDCAVETGTWSELRNRAVLAIDSSHRTHPEDFGLSLSDLHAILRPHLPVDDLFDALIKDLCGTEFVRVGSMIRRANFQPALPPGLQEIGAKLREALGRKPFDPPSRKELSPDAAWQQALRFLLETGEVVEINADVVMFSESQKQAAEIIRRFIREHGPATVSDLRQAIGSSRRVIIPLLEWLDRAGVTERAGDRRALREMRPGPKAKLSTL